MSEVDHWSHQQFSDAEITAIVEEAARAERFVAAHAEGKAGIMAALRCGVQTIEHGDEIDDEVTLGMVLIPEGSSGCTCGYTLQTSMGFIPVND